MRWIHLIVRNINIIDQRVKIHISLPKQDKRIYRYDPADDSRLEYHNRSEKINKTGDFVLTKIGDHLCKFRTVHGSLKNI